MPKSKGTSGNNAVTTPERKRKPNGDFAPGNREGFQPGQSGNPKGRPPGKSFKEVYAYCLDRILRDLPSEQVDKFWEQEMGRKMTYREAVSLRQIAKAIRKGDTKAAQLVQETADGKPKQDVAITAHEIVFRQVHDREQEEESQPEEPGSEQ